MKTAWKQERARPQPEPYASQFTSAMAQHTQRARGRGLEESRARPVLSH